MKNREQRINNIVGQLEGIKKMLLSDKDCFNVLIQMKAAKSALNSLIHNFIDENFIHCMKQPEARRNYQKLRKLFLEVSKRD